MSSIIKSNRLTNIKESNTLRLEIMPKYNSGADVLEEEKEDLVESYTEKVEKLKYEYENLLKEIDEAKTKMYTELEVEKESIIEEFKKEGFSAGYSEGEGALKSEYDSKEKELYSGIEEMKAEFENYKIESAKILKDQVVNLISNSLKMVFDKAYKDNEEFLNILVTKGLMEIYEEKKINISLSEEDFEKINKEKLLENIENKEVNFMVDKSKKPGECIIETDIGFIDCSMDTILNNINTIITSNVFNENN